MLTEILMLVRAISMTLAMLLQLTGLQTPMMALLSMMLHLLMMLFVQCVIVLHLLCELAEHIIVGLRKQQASSKPHRALWLLSLFAFIPCAAAMQRGGSPQDGASAAMAGAASAMFGSAAASLSQSRGPGVNQRRGSQARSIHHGRPMPDFVENLDPEVLDSVVRLLTQAVEQYGGIESPEVRTDVVAKFQITDAEFTELVQFLYGVSYAAFSDDVAEFSDDAPESINQHRTSEVNSRRRSRRIAAAGPRSHAAGTDSGSEDGSDDSGDSDDSNDSSYADANDAVHQQVASDEKENDKLEAKCQQEHEERSAGSYKQQSPDQKAGGAADDGISHKRQKTEGPAKKKTNKRSGPRAAIIGVPSGSAASTPAQQLVDEFQRSHYSIKAYHVKENNGFPDVQQLRNLHEVLKDLTEHTFRTEFPDRIMDAPDMFVATPEAIRETMAKLRQWELDACALVTAIGVDRARIHLYAAATAAALLTTVMELCGSTFTGSNSKTKISVGKKKYELYGRQMNTLSWYFAIAGRYSYLGTSDYIDVEESVYRLMNKDLHVEATTVKMLEWREQADKHVAEKVKNAEIVEVINIILDSWAITMGEEEKKKRETLSDITLKRASTKAPAGLQGGHSRPYILSSTAQNGHTHPSNSVWRNVFRVNVVQLQKLDARYGTSLAAMATAAWKGDDTIAGQAVAYSSKSALATRSCYWGRTYPLSILLPSVLETQYKDYTITVYKCPTYYWPHFLATERVFTLVDELITGYVDRESKSLTNHMAEDPNDDVTAAARGLLLESSDTSQQQCLMTQKETTTLSTTQHQKMHKDKKNLISAFRKTYAVDLSDAKIKAWKGRGPGPKPKLERELPRW
eukprot:SAG31_NODE_2119_length_6406_cov_2.443317_1_plen_856_part_00